MHHLRPLMTHSSPSRTAVVCEVRRVRARDVGLGHREAGARAALGQRAQVGLELLRRCPRSAACACSPRPGPSRSARARPGRRRRTPGRSAPCRARRRPGRPTPRAGAGCRCRARAPCRAGAPRRASSSGRRAGPRSRTPRGARPPATKARMRPRSSCSWGGTVKSMTAVGGRGRGVRGHVRRSSRRAVKRDRSARGGPGRDEQAEDARPHHEGERFGVEVGADGAVALPALHGRGEVVELVALGALRDRGQGRGAARGLVEAAEQLVEGRARGVELEARVRRGRAGARGPCHWSSRRRPARRGAGSPRGRRPRRARASRRSGGRARPS